MNIATLYVYGEDDDLDRLTELLGLAGTSRWKAGDLRHQGKVHASAGIQFDLADTDTPHHLVDAVRCTLIGWHAKGLSLARLTLRGELSIGVTVGDNAQFTAHVEFSPHDMVMLGAIGVALSIAAYPTSDEANDLID